MRRLMLPIIAVVLLGVVAGLASPDPAAAFSRRANERTLFKLINHARTQRGLVALSWSSSLHRAALSHSRDMLRRDYFGHSSPSGISYSTRVRRAGYSRSGCTSWSAGEVIAWGKRYRGTPQSIFRGWMRSGAHRRVILSKGWRDVGVGCARGTYRGMSGVIMYTIDFGRRQR